MTAGPRAPGAYGVSTPPVRTAAGWILVGALAMAGLVAAAVFGLALLHALAIALT